MGLTIPIREVLYVFKKRKYHLSTVHLCGVYEVVLSLIGLEKLDVVAGQFSISVLLRGVVDDFVWACTGVYDLNENGQRPTL